VVEELLAEVDRLRDAGDPSRALALAMQAVRSAPHRLDAWLQVAALQSKLGQHVLAVGSFNAMLARVAHPSRIRAHLLALRAQALLDAGLWSSAVEGIDAAASIRERDLPTEHLIGILYSHLGRIGKAKVHLKTAADASPTNASYQYSLGAVYRFEGRASEAEEAIERAISLAPQVGQSHLTLAHLSTWRADRNHCGRLAALLARSDLSMADRATLHFAAHKEHHDLGDYAPSWRHLVTANELVARDNPWIDAEDDMRFTATRREFSIARLRAAAAASAAVGDSPRPRPIFIVGLPRSGSTLVERILSAHSAVHSMGELPILDAVRRRLGAADSMAIGAAYREEIRALSGGARFAIDKLPANYWHVGLIREALPEALIIVTQRQPMDVLFGAYRTHLGRRYSWSYSLSALVQHYARFIALMSHWSEGLGSGFIEIKHERLVRAPDTEIRRLLEACGLDPEAACFEPHKNAAAATTASALQVRRPVSDRGFDAWKPYAAELTPLSAALSARGFPTSG
jgi:tetratricopeptide (TPR) repeat protein